MKSKPQKGEAWSDVKRALEAFDRLGLLSVIRALFDTSAANRRFLRARFLPAGSALQEYRDLVQLAVFPPPMSQRPIRLRDATAAIAEYRRSTGDLAGVVDLLLTFVEAGTEQAADLGYGDDAYFGTLERKLDEAVSALGELPHEARRDATARVIRLGEYQDCLGWGYGDFLGETAGRLQARGGHGSGRRATTRSHKRMPR